MSNLRNFRLLFVRAWMTARGYFLLTLVKNIFSALMPLVNLFGIGVVVDALTVDMSLEEVTKRILIYLSVNLAISMIRHGLTLCENNEMRRASNVLQFAYMEDCLQVDYSCTQDGKLQNLRGRAMMAQPAFFIAAWGRAFDSLLQFLGVVFVFSVLTPSFVLVILAVSALLIWMNLTSQKYDFYFSQQRVEEDRKLDYLYTVMTSYKYAKEIRINCADQFIKGKFSATFNGQLKRLRALYRQKAWIGYAGNLLTVAQAAVMYLYFTWQVFTGEVSLAEYTVLLSAATLSTSSLLALFASLGQIHNNCKAEEFYQEYTEMVQKNSGVSASNKQEEPDIDFSKAVFRFEDVSFRYPNQKEYALRHVNIEIMPNKKLGIVGLNGSGKTTLVRLLCRLYDPQEGRITVDNVDIRQIPYDFYIQHMGIVLQDFTLFAYSVRENIVCNSPVDGEKIEECIEKSGLSDRIRELPEGIETYIYKDLDNTGVEFSGGEEQKLVFARALYKNANILILDEPTSSLDPKAELAFFKQFYNITADKTAIFISHRLSSTRFCDEIIVLEQGVLVERGNHEVLLEQGGRYAELFELQARHFKKEGISV